MSATESAEKWLDDHPQVKKWLNDSRIRSVIAGGLGGFVGWMLAELVFGQPSATETLWVGLIIGAGIGVILGAAEGLVIRSSTLAKRGALIGLGVGALGGSVGAMFAQVGYAATVGGAQPEDSPGAGSVFSVEMRERLQDAGARTGEIEIGLLWRNTNDLDLHVVDPSGETIFFDHKRSRSGGELDVDRNAGCSNPTNTPVEHIVWPEGAAPLGEYQVYVVHYQNCGPPDPTEYEVEILIDGHQQSFRGSVQYQAGRPRHHVHTFTRGGGEEFAVSAPSFLSVLARILGWTVFGALVGCAEGLTRKSLLGLRNAAIGGAIGGAVGGFAFDVIARIVMPLGFTDTMGRFLGFVILGACIGLWIVLIERALSAVIAVQSGRFEGREIFLDKKEMRVGRNDSLEIFLGGDPEIAKHHATFRQEGGTHSLVPVEGSVTVNENPIAATRQLRDGDRIKLGNTRLAYAHKAAPESKDGSKETSSSQQKSGGTQQGARRPPTPPPPPPPPPGRRRS